jgi:hypothetical protein
MHNDTIVKLSGKEKNSGKKHHALPALRECAHHRTRLTLRVPALQGLQPTVSGEAVVRFA